MITKITVILKNRQPVRRKYLLLSQYLCGASKIGSACFGRLSSYYSNCQQEKKKFLSTFKHKRSCFLVFYAPSLYLVGISYLPLLHSSANITKLWSRDRGPVNPILYIPNFSIAQINSLVPWFFASEETLSQYLELFLQFELFPQIRDGSSYREPIADLFWQINSLSNM